MGWAEGIDWERERSRRLLLESRIHLVLEVPEGFSIKTDLEQVPRTGGERIHIMVDGPALQMPRE